MALRDKQVSAFDAKTHLSRLLREVKEGQAVTITRRGRPVARLVPAEQGQDGLDTGRLLELFAGIRGRARGPVAIRDLIVEGRKG